ncbi:unnamed protein product [Paramecium octaurelia]|uniref:Uncharacterized protein n=1 Tax=Paramecium octaurelia TaxID=43137 RepID=A0A8S1SIJ7_PAROT|nr:unnamed protein product [Paramecium octaurelia]
MNQLIKQVRVDQPISMVVNVVVNLNLGKISLQANVDPDIPFNVFIEEILEQIFNQELKSIQAQNTIQCKLESGKQIQNQIRNGLNSLGFTNGCTLQVQILQGIQETPQPLDHYYEKKYY